MLHEICLNHSTNVTRYRAGFTYRHVNRRESSSWFMDSANIQDATFI